MNILIIEDEQPAARRLSKLVQDHGDAANIVGTIDSVESSVKWLQTFPAPDLIFMDIQLADGLSFDIFTKVEITSPIIFTTAYDQYALKAFKVNSVDYLLKPIDPDDLQRAFAKYKNLYQQQEVAYDQDAIQQLIASMTRKEYKERFLVKTGQHLQYVNVEDVAYFYSEGGLVHLQSIHGKRHILDYTLDQLERMLDPDCFFRINRKIITNICAVKKIHTYFNSRLLLELLPKINLEVIVSRDRVGDFKRWLDK